MTQTPQRTRATFLIRNQTPRRLEIIGSHNRLKLAPLEQIRVDYRPHEHLGQAAVYALADRAVAWEKEPVRSTKVWATAWLTLIGFLSVGAAVLIMLSNQRLWWLAVAAAVVAALCIVAAAVLNRPGDETDDDPLAGTVDQRLSGWRFTKDVALSTLQKLALVIVLAVGILGPTAAIYYGSELSSILSVSGWQIDLVSDESSYPIVVARSLQIGLVVILALIPGLMYFQFDREKLATLMDRWVHHAFRLDPPLPTLMRSSADASKSSTGHRSTAAWPRQRSGRRLVAPCTSRPCCSASAGPCCCSMLQPTSWFRAAARSRERHQSGIFRPSCNSFNPPSRR
jgi:hypothetical protein